MFSTLFTVVPLALFAATISAESHPRAMHNSFAKRLSGIAIPGGRSRMLACESLLYFYAEKLYSDISFAYLPFPSHATAILIYEYVDEVVVPVARPTSRPIMYFSNHKLQFFLLIHSTPRLLRSIKQ